MHHLDWVEEPHGWRSGRYSIELAAPLLWVVSCTEGPQSEGEVVPASVELTTGSLQAAKRAAGVLEARRVQRRRVRLHVSLVVIACLVWSLATVAPVGWVAPVAVALVPLCIRSVLVLTKSLMGRSFESVREIYQ